MLTNLPRQRGGFSGPGSEPDPEPALEAASPHAIPADLPRLERDPFEWTADELREACRTAWDWLASSEPQRRRPRS